jgi:hypothetical protein
MNINRILGIAIAVLAVWAGAASQLSVLFGQHVSDIIVTVSSLTVASLGAVLGVLSTPITQTTQIAAVRAMPGVEDILINSKASPEAARLAVDPTVDKIRPTTADKAAVEEIAKTAV